MSTSLHQRAPQEGERFKNELLKEAEEKEITEGQKFVLPDFTVKQLLDAIPWVLLLFALPLLMLRASCFHRSALRSSVYILQDVTVISALVYGIYHADSFLSRFELSSTQYTAAKAGLWMGYWFLTGCFATGLWVIACVVSSHAQDRAHFRHECGHQAFSPSKTINNAVGWVLHSALLVPYHSWRISHARHHAATNHTTRDEVHVARTRKDLKYPERKEEGEALGINVSAFRQAELREALEESPIAVLYGMLLQQVFGWPLYLFTNASGQTWYPKGTNHFNPSAIIFKPHHLWQIIGSDVGCFITLAALGVWTYFRGFTEMFTVYFIPYLMVNHWLVMITYLQHTDPVIPHYTANTWTFARGALATVDRTLMGPFGAYVFHGICETHVSHHISSKIPHYNAWKATTALKEYLGPHYQRSEENMFVSFYRCYRDCLFIEDGQDVAFYKNAAGVAQRIPVDASGNISDSGVDMGVDSKKA